MVFLSMYPADSDMMTHYMYKHWHEMQGFPTLASTSTLNIPSFVTYQAMTMFRFCLVLTLLALIVALTGSVSAYPPSRAFNDRGIITLESRTNVTPTFPDSPPTCSLCQQASFFSFLSTVCLGRSVPFVSNL